MNEQANTRTVQPVYEHFKSANTGSGDFQSLLSLYSDDVEWLVPDMENVRYGGKRRGLKSVREFFSSVADDLEVLQFEPQEFIAQGDKVVALGRYSWRVKATGKEFSSDWAHVCTVRDGKIVRFREYMDTAAEIRARQKS
jgi:ketosteroid isomerase-like protein